MDGALRTILDRFMTLVDYVLLAVRSFGYAIADGTVSGSAGLYLFGRMESNPAATMVPVWVQAIAYTWMSVDRTLFIGSTSANDTLLGSGAQRVRVWWLDAAGVESTVDVNMNGLGAAPTGVVTARRVNRAEVIQVGVTGANEGDVVVYYLDGAPVYQAKIPAGRGINDGVIQTVPAGKRDVIWWWSGDVGSAKYPIYTLNIRASGTAPWLIADRVCVFSESPSDNLRYYTPLILPAGTDYFIGGWESGGAIPLAGALTGWREDA